MDKRKRSQNAFYCLLYFSLSCIGPVLYIFTVLFYLLLWVRSMEVHLILDLFIHSPIQVMDREKSHFRSYSSLAVWIFAFQCWYAFTMFVYISLKKLLWVYMACLSIYGFEYIWLYMLSVLSWVSIGLNPQDVMEILAINRGNSCQLLTLNNHLFKRIILFKRERQLNRKKDFLSLKVSTFYGGKTKHLDANNFTSFSPAR